MEDKITIQNLDLYYSEFHALKDINMHIREKEITAFIGPSGCGKSTLLRCLNRMNDLVEGCRVTGKVLLNGDDIYLNDDVNMLRKRVGMVFQNGGQQQRLCIARALAVQPEVLLMDEPTSALDPISTLKIEDLAVELKQNYTIVIVTHNMQQAVRISDKTAFFLLGEVIEFNDTETLFSNPKEKKTEDYITGRFG